MSTPAEAAQLPLAKLRGFKNDPHRVHIVLRKPGSEPGSAKKEMLVVFEDYPRAVLVNLTKYNTLPILPRRYGELAPGVFMRMTAEGIFETGPKPPSPRLIVNGFEFDEMKELLEFNLRYCDGDKSGWPPVLRSGKLDLIKTLKLLGTAAIFGTYTLHEATKEYLASTPSCEPKTRDILRAALVNGPRVIEKHANAPGVSQTTGLNSKELVDLFKRQKILPDNLNVAGMSKEEIEESAKRLEKLNVGNSQQVMSIEEVSSSIDSFMKARPAESRSEETKERNKGENKSKVVEKDYAEKESDDGNGVDDEDRGPAKTAGAGGERMPEVPNSEADSSSEEHSVDSESRDDPDSKEDARIIYEESEQESDDTLAIMLVFACMVALLLAYTLALG